MRISVVIPCYNVEDYIRPCLESVLGQTHQDLEVICVDDGSTDGTQRIIEEVRSANPARLSVIQQTNRGAAAARNKGLQHATGEYLQLMDADDLLDPRKIAHQVELTATLDKPDIIAGSYTIQNADGSIMRHHIYDKPGLDVWFNLMHADLGNTVSNLWKRSSVIGAGAWNEEQYSSQEYDLMFRMLRNGARAEFDPVSLTTVRKRLSGSISQTNVAENWVRYVELRSRMLEHLRASSTARDIQPYTQFLFDSIRVLYHHDRKSAIELHDRSLPKNFVPGPSPTTGRTYLFFHRLFGFRIAQRIWRIFA
ncbi:MAG: glycosyltransferase family A protein [Flavobacteriales bacterium]